MVSISLGGKELNPPLLPDPTPTMSHLGYLMFDAVTWCQLNRSQAIKLHTRITKLQAMIDANPGHKDNPRALGRISTLNNEFLTHQVQFLKWEASIHSLWKHASPKELEAEDCDELCHALPDEQSLPLLWHHPLGSQEGAPITCPMTTTSLQFSTREMLRRYRTSGIR